MELTNLLINKNEYEKLFKVKLNYNFPSLKIDKDGIFTGEINNYDKYDKFKLVNNNYEYNLLNPDIEIERFIIENKIKQIKIDLKQNIVEPLQNHSCFIYPEIIRKNNIIYDTLYLTNYLLKHIYYIIMTMIIYNTNEEMIKQNTFLISLKEVNGFYKIKNIIDDNKFIRLIYLVKKFINEYNLKKKQLKIKTEYYKLKEQNGVMHISITYEDIKFSYENSIINFEKLKGKINIVYIKDNEILTTPSYTIYFIKFFNKYYDNIKTIFPIFNRLENIYRLICLNTILDDFNIETRIDNTIYIDTYVSNILCSSSILLIPTKFIRILNTPIEPITNYIIKMYEISRKIQYIPLKIGTLYHAGIMIKTIKNEYYILEYIPTGNILRQIYPKISSVSIIENNCEWSIDNYFKLKQKNYNPERLKELMDIITFEEPYDLINNNCQDVKQKILDALL